VYLLSDAADSYLARWAPTCQAAAIRLSNLNEIAVFYQTRHQGRVDEFPLESDTGGL
jgi:hypothetical protein